MKVLCVFGQHNYGNPSRSLGYEYTNFIPALKNLGHKVSFFESLNKFEYKNYGDLNRKFLEKVESENPDIIFCVLMTYEIWLETLQLIREGSDAALIHWATDDSWKYEQFSRFIAPAFDLYATTYPSAMRKAAVDGHDNFILTQWAANSDAMKPPLPASECSYQVSFVGSAYGNRMKWIEDLKSHGIEVDCFGYGWPNGPVSSEEIPEIMRKSVISLNLSDSGIVIQNGRPVRSRQIKARVFEVPGAGGFLMTEPAEHLDEFYKYNEEIAVFEDLEGLVSKIRSYLSNPDERDRMAAAGYTRTKQSHTYESRFQVLFDRAASIKRGMVAKEKAGIDFEHFSELIQKQHPNLLLKALKSLLLLPCLLIWGRSRGPRAARRILFEISWRLLGRQTYSVKSWPGRLFYRES